MEINNNTTLLEALLAKKNNGTKTSQNNPAPPPLPPAKTGRALEVVKLSQNNNSKHQSGSRLVSEDIEKIENGFRRIQEFETSKGKKFTRIEELTSDDDRTRRTVIQQNESGSTTVLENILDRQDNGTFRQTQRFTNEIGETSTDIKYNVTASNVNQILGVPPSPDSRPPQPFQTLRGTQLDIVT